MRFRRTRKGILSRPDEVEAVVLARCVRDLLTLLGDTPAPEDDPLAALVGMPSGDAVRPEDPALVRLLPDAYGDTDREASAEFRRYTDDELREGKRATARTVLATLPPAGGAMLLDRDDADAWLGCLNDLRLVLGTRLSVTEDLDPDDLPADDPRLEALQVYGWLGWLQESLLGTLEPRR